MKNNGKIIVELQESMGSDASIANAAWSSTYDKVIRDIKYDDREKVEDLVPKLIRSNHGTPIESVIFRFWIRMPLYTDRQHMTHRIASHNGLSGRYRTVPDDWYSVPRDVVGIMDKALGNGGGEAFKKEYDDMCDASNDLYRNQISELKAAEKSEFITNAEYKRAREVLRGQLPQANMLERTTIMNLRSFANYMRQRLDAHAQPEIREVAEQMLAQVEAAGTCPVAIATLKEIGWKL